MSLPPEASTPSFLQYTGIPPAWLKKRPRLPSRNWLIFLSTTAAITGLYVHDRRRCTQIRDQYIEKVKHLSEHPLSSLEMPRKVTVYGSKWPVDEDADRSLKYFRKYVKPILVAAAVDYEMINGKRHGNLADLVANKIKSRRRIELGLDRPPPSSAIPIPGHGPAEQRKRELEGGIVIIGRHTFKEFMHGLKRGWSEPLHIVDKEEILSRELESDNVFDEVDTEDPNEGLLQDEAPSDTKASPTSVTGSPFYFPPRLAVPPKNPANRMENANEDPNLHAPPSSIPTYPPILLVPFTNLIGFSLIPRMIWDFFNQRQKVHEGAEAAYRLIVGTPRPIRGPSGDNQLGQVESSPLSDLSFDLQAESFYKSTSLASETEKSRKSYYEALRPKIITARELTRGLREPTKEEKNYPPPTEVELRAERMKKELRWRDDLSGWAIINPEEPVTWDPRFADALWIYPQK